MGGKSAQAAIAANRDVCDCPPSATQDCSSVLHVAIFFDGTGNNDEVDAKASKWSNVARIYYSANLAAQDDTSRTLFPIYIAGVGTAFNGAATNWLAGAGIWIEDSFPGAAAGAGGDRRMRHGEDSVNESLRRVLFANAKALGGVAAKYAADASSNSFREVNAALAKHRLIKMVNLSVFGFSRGAALARAFTNRIIGQCDRRNDEFLYHQYPFRIGFLGLFDTVASFGVPAQNVRTPFTERELVVPDAVERCVHYVAAHELRFSFPVDLIRRNGKLTREWTEHVYPGAHADVGGGYEPNEQEVDCNYSRIPMREMMREALSSGVRILSYDHIKQTQAAVFAERFECRPETELAFSRYAASCPVAGGTVEQQIIAHLKLYYSAHGTMARRGIKSAGDRSRDGSKYKYIIGSKGPAYEVWAYRLVQKAGRWLRLSDATVRQYAQYIQIQDWQLSAWDSTAADATVDFVSRFIHDSKVDFLSNIEPFSYFRPRGVDESSISVWQEGGNWLRGKVHDMSNRANEIVEVGKVNARRAADATVAAIKGATGVVAKSPTDTPRHAVNAGTQKVDDLENSGERIYEGGLNWILRKKKNVGELGG